MFKSYPREQLGGISYVRLFDFITVTWSFENENKKNFEKFWSSIYSYISLFIIDDQNFRNFKWLWFYEESRILVITKIIWNN